MHSLCETFGSDSLHRTPADLFRDDRETYRKRFSQLLERHGLSPDSVLPEPWYFRRLSELAAHVERLVAGTLEQPRVRMVPDARRAPRLASRPVEVRPKVDISTVSSPVPEDANAVA